jgi:hypothetical protein
MPHLPALREILKLTGLRPSPAVRQHIVRLRALLSFLARIKRNRHELPNLAMALNQACLEVETREGGRLFIPIDGVPAPEQIARIRTLGGFPEELSVEEIVGLIGLVDPSKSAADIALPITWTPPPLAPPIVDGWPAYGLREIPAEPVKLCPTTCRPYYRVAPAEIWPAAAERRYGAAPTKLLSVNEAYGNYVIRYRAYPTRDELLIALYHRRVLSGRHATLPHQIGQFVDEVIADAAELTAVIPAEEFARRCAASRKVETRLAREAAA